MERQKGHKGVIENLGAASAGAVDELLFGLPEYAIKNLGGREGVEKYIKEHEKAYRTGEGVGTVASMFVPVPGAAAIKGAGLAAKAAKLAKGADTASDIAKLAKGAGTVADISKLSKVAKAADTVGDIEKVRKTLDFGKLAARGAITGGAEAGVRGVTSEKTAGEILNDIKTGATFGAGGGILGGALTRNAPRYADELAKTTEKAYLGTTDLGRRQALAYLKDVAGPGAKGIGKFKAADQARKELVRVGKEIGAHIPGKMDEAILEHAAKWDKLDDIMEKAAPNVRGSELYTAAAEKLDLPALYKEFGEDAVNGFIKQVQEEGVSRSGLANARAFLGDLVKASYSQGGLKTGRDEAMQRMQRQIAQKLRTGVDEIVMDTAKKAGTNIDITKLKKDYLPMRAIAESGAIADITPSRVNLGSPTMEKLAMSGAGTALGFSQGDDLETRIKNAAIGGIGGFAAKQAIGKLATKGIASAAPLANLASGALEKIAPEALEKIGASVGGQAASVIARQAIEEAAPTTPEAAESAETAAVSDTPEYQTRILTKMREYAAANGVDPESTEFQEFAGQVYAATDGFAPEKIGVILYHDPEEQAAYLKALEVSRGLRKVLPTATGKTGFGATDEEKIQREAAANQLAALVSDAVKDKGVGAEAKKSILKHLSSGKSPEEKASLVKATLLAYGVDVDELEQMGVV